MRRPSICTTAVAWLIVASGAIAGPSRHTIPVEGTWEDLAGKFGWNSTIEFSEDTGEFHGKLPTGLDVRGTRRGERVNATLEANGKEVGHFEGTIIGDRVHGSYTVADDKEAVSGEATWRTKEDHQGLSR